MNLRLLLFLLLLGTAAHAQKAPHPPLNDPNPPPVLPPGEAFVGVWEWAAGNETFQLTLTRNPAYVLPAYPNAPPGNAVFARFVYTRNGTVVDHSLSTGPRPYAAIGRPKNNHRLDLLFYDHGTNGYGELTLSFPATNPDVLDWSLATREMFYRNPADRPAVPFLVPTTMTLTRQP